MHITPAILEKKYEAILYYIDRYAPFSSLIHIDIADGVYVPTKTWPFVGDQTASFATIHEHGLPQIAGVGYELDLMVLDPMHDIETYLAMKPSHIVFHADSCDLQEVLEYKANGGFGQCKIGVAFGVEQHPSWYGTLLQGFDYVQCMAIHEVGKQGEAFTQDVTHVIDEVTALLPSVTTMSEITVDGAMRPDTVALVANLGVTRIVVGSYLRDAGSVEEALATFADVLY
jgi:pentose-5-phosphate-3-epimerase